MNSNLTSPQGRRVLLLRTNSASSLISIRMAGWAARLRSTDLSVSLSLSLSRTFNLRYSFVLFGNWIESNSSNDSSRRGTSVGWRFELTTGP